RVPSTLPRGATGSLPARVADAALALSHASRAAWHAACVRRLMPYATRTELPAAVRRNLPAHAQDIYRQAFNQAHLRYGDEEVAHRVVWAAVKKSYQKLGDAWVPRS